MDIVVFVTIKNIFREISASLLFGFGVFYPNIWRKDALEDEARSHHIENFDSYVFYWLDRTDSFKTTFDTFLVIFKRNLGLTSPFSVSVQC